MKIMFYAKYTEKCTKLRSRKSYELQSLSHPKKEANSSLSDLTTTLYSIRILWVAQSTCVRVHTMCPAGGSQKNTIEYRQILFIYISYLRYGKICS